MASLCSAFSIPLLLSKPYLASSPLLLCWSRSPASRLLSSVPSRLVPLPLTAAADGDGEVWPSSFDADEFENFDGDEFENFDAIGGGIEEGEEEEDGEPWAGAVVYRRDPSVAHVEFRTSLERLGLARLSSPVSRARASAMGIRCSTPLGGAGEEEETAVVVSVDVTRRRRKQRLRVDGIVRTVITLACNRCAEPVGKCVFSNFALLLTEQPVVEPEDKNNMSLTPGEEGGNQRGPSARISTDEEEDADNNIDWEDWLHFPADEKQIDISKNIRDIIHLEITVDEVCATSCKGLCLHCFTNLNWNTCNCGQESATSAEQEDRSAANMRLGQLKSLKQQLQQR